MMKIIREQLTQKEIEELEIATYASGYHCKSDNQIFEGTFKICVVVNDSRKYLILGDFPDDLGWFENFKIIKKLIRKIKERK